MHDQDSYHFLPWFLNVTVLTAWERVCLPVGQTVSPSPEAAALAAPVGWLSGKRPSLRARCSAFHLFWVCMLLCWVQAARIWIQSRLPPRRVGVGCPEEPSDLRLVRGRWRLVYLPSPAVCPAPRSESRSAVRIKVLDVLSFVLLINRQFYEVRAWAAAGALGRRGRGGLRGPCRALLASEAACGPSWGPSVAGFVSSLTPPSLPPARPMAERPGGHSPCLQENRLVWGRFPFTL